MKVKRSGDFKFLMFTFLVKATALVLLLTVFKSMKWTNHIFVDIWGWQDYLGKCKTGLIPYVNFSKEYPVGAGLLYWAMSFFYHPEKGADNLLWVHGLFMLVADVACGFLFYKICRVLNEKRAVFLSSLFVLLPTGLILSPFRFEPWVNLTVLLGYFALLKKKPQKMAFFWSLGATMKWYPAFFLFIETLREFLEDRNWKNVLRRAGVFGAVFGGMNLPPIALGLFGNGTFQNWWATYAFHLHRPLYWDTVLGAGSLWFGKIPFEQKASLLSLLLLLAAFAWRPRARLEYKAAVVCAAILVLNRVYSTQFHLWFYPLLLLGLARENSQALFKKILIALAGLDFTNILVYPFAFNWSYGELGGFNPGEARLHGGWGTAVFSAAIVLRALLLLGMTWLLSRSDLMSARSTVKPASLVRLDALRFQRNRGRSSEAPLL